MSPSDLETELAKRFPSYFPIDGECLEYGCLVGEGWNDIVLQLFEDIENLNEPSFEVDCIREKNSTLAIYCDETTEGVSNLLDSACEKACCTCEACGCEKPSPYTHQDDFLVHEDTICPACEKLPYALWTPHDFREHLLTEYPEEYADRGNL